MESGLLPLEGNPHAEQLNAIFRGAHSIKGASGTFGFDQVMRFTHAMESLLDEMRGGRVLASRTRIDLLLSALDVLRRLLDAARTGAAIPDETERLVELMLVAQRSGEFSPPQPVAVRAADAHECWSIRFVPSPDVLRQGMDPVLVLRELRRLGEIRRIDSDLSRIPALAELGTDTCYLGWTVPPGSTAIACCPAGPTAA